MWVRISQEEYQDEQFEGELAQQPFDLEVRLELREEVSSILHQGTIGDLEDWGFQEGIDFRIVSPE